MRRKVSFSIKPGDIELIVYDFDGVMTDNRVLVSEDGTESVFCNRGDGMAVQKIREQGIPQVILSTEHNRVVEKRAKKLGIEVLYGVQDKKKALFDYCRKRRYNLKRVVYIGNDINDLEAMKLVGCPFASQDAAGKVKRIAAVFKKRGGEGVIREFFEEILKM